MLPNLLMLEKLPSAKMKYFSILCLAQDYKPKAMAL
jgi:hypothetical protein